MEHTSGHNIFSLKSKISNFHIALLCVVVVFEVAIHYYLSLSLFQRISYLGPTLLSLYCQQAQLMMRLGKIKMNQVKFAKKVKMRQLLKMRQVKFSKKLK